MSRFGGYDEPRGGGGRWDSDRFARERERAERRGPPVIERDRFEEYERFEAPPRRRDLSADAFYHGGGRRAPARYEEQDRYIFEEKISQPLVRRPRGGPGRYYEDDVDSFDDSPSRGGQMVPFERKRESIADRGYGPTSMRSPPRPGLLRRQSSLDTFDRKPLPRYPPRPREPPETIVIPSRPRRRSPPRFVERDFEEIRVAEPDFYGDDEYRGYREREISTVRRRRADSEVRERDIYEEREEIVEREFPRRGKTRMPMRLVNRRAVIELGYPYEEEGETLIILKALGKEHIDEVIRISREMNTSGAAREESRTTYMIEAPAPPPPPQEPQVIERRTEIIHTSGPPPEVPRSVRDWDAHSAKAERRSERHRSPSPSHASRHHHSPSPSHASHHHHSPQPSVRREIIIDDGREESASIHHGPITALVAPPDRRRDERSIKAEIRALEAEKKALKLEREMEKEQRRADRYRDGGKEIVIERIARDKDVVKIEKDKKVPDPRIIRAMLATLT